MRKYNNGNIAGWIIGLILLCIFEPVIYFGCAWFGGWILQIFIGDTVANGLNLIFNTTRFTPDIIPIACATLATIGGFFKTHVSSSKN